MKKQILSFALVATMISAFAVGCSSSEKATTSDTTMADTTMVDTSRMMDTATMVDTTRKM